MDAGHIITVIVLAAIIVSAFVSTGLHLEEDAALTIEMQDV